MFDTEKFITEVHKRICLWNITDKSYSDRDAKRVAWYEIAEILNEKWRDTNETEKQTIIKNLQKKWKHLRDYYTREKKKTGDGRSGSAAKKRKKTPMYFDILTFLDVTKQSRWTESNVDFNESEGDTHNELEATTSTEQRSHTDTSKPCFRVKRPKTTLFQETLPKPMEESTTNVKSEADPNKQFLMSLLPEMHSMSERQNFEFRFQIMNILRNIKYKTTSHASNRPNSFNHNIMYQNLPPQTNAHKFRKTRSCVKPR